VLFSGDEVYDEDTTSGGPTDSGVFTATDRPCEEGCGAPAGVECAEGCPSVWDPR
jgi:hypothetical protein